MNVSYFVGARVPRQNDDDVRLHINEIQRIAAERCC